MTGAPVAAGMELILDATAGAQFARRPLRVRVIRVLPHHAPWGLVWIEVYVLTVWHDAVVRRELLVRVDALHRAAGRGAVAHPRRRMPVSP